MKMKKTRWFFSSLLALIMVLSAFPGKASAKSYHAAELKVGDIVHMSSFITFSEKTRVEYYYSVQEEKPFQTYVYEAGSEHSVKTIGDIFDCVVLYNEVAEGMRVIEFYPLVNNGVGGVGVCGLMVDESVLAGSWLDFDGCRGKSRTIRYFTDGETEPFHTETAGSRYMRVLKRTGSAALETPGYTVSYWHVKNVDSYSGVIDLVAGRDIGLTNMVKANEMYRGQIIAAGTLIDYSAARYVSFHFYQSEVIYERGKEFYCFDYGDRKKGEERFIIAGAGYPYTAYKVMSANTSHVHLAAISCCFETSDESVVNAIYLRPGDVVYNGSVLTYDSYGSKTVTFCSADRTPVSGEEITNPQGIKVSNPEGVEAVSWVVFETGTYGLKLLPLKFSAEGLLIPSYSHQNEAYSGACVELDGRNYYYYDRLSVAIADAKVNASLSRSQILGADNEFKKDFDSDRVLLLRNVDLIDSSFGTVQGVGKGIVIDFNGHNASGVRVALIPEKETLVFTNSSEKKSCISGSDAFLDNNTKEARTGTVVFHNLNIASKIYPSMHTLYLLDGTYILNSATVMDNSCDNRIIRDTEACPLYKFYADYPYWVCSITPADPSLDYPNGRRVEKNGVIAYYYTDIDTAKAEAKSGDVLEGENVERPVAPTSGENPPSPAKPHLGESEAAPDDPAGNDSFLRVFLTIILPVMVIAAFVAVAGILIIKKKKKK